MLVGKSDASITATSTATNPHAHGLSETTARLPRAATTAPTSTSAPREVPAQARLAPRAPARASVSVQHCGTMCGPRTRPTPKRFSRVAVGLEDSTISWMVAGAGASTSTCDSTAGNTCSRASSQAIPTRAAATCRATAARGRLTVKRERPPTSPTRRRTSRPS
jgi:hypothetical protein